MALTNVVVRKAPFQRTTDEATKPLPLTVSVRPALLAAAPVGERLLATGTGRTDEAGGAGGAEGAVAEPPNPRETESLPAMKFTLPAKPPTVVGRNRTVTV